MTQYLYLILCNVDQNESIYKIGVANDIQSRLAQLQTGSPFELEVMMCFEFDNAEIAERAIHQAYKSYHVRGEWFRLGYGAIERFRNLCALLGGVTANMHGEVATEDDIEEAEEISEAEYEPTIDDVRKIMNDPSYRLEYRYNEYGLRGFAWRLRTGNKSCPLYIGKRSPIFEQVKAILPEHKLAEQEPKP